MKNLNKSSQAQDTIVPKSKWWAPNSYKKVHAENAHALLDDPSLGIGDSIFLLAYMGDKIFNFKRIYVEPRAYCMYKELCANYNIKFPSKVLRRNILSRQLFKSLLVSKTVKGLIPRFLFKLYIKFNPRMASLTSIDNDQYLNFTQETQLAKNNMVDLSKITNKSNSGYALTFVCARKDSYLTPICMTKISQILEKPVLVQHFINPDLKDDYIRTIRAEIHPLSYLGRDPIQQVRMIQKTSLLISVASSVSKFAITIGHPLLLILFTSHNSSFLRYYENLTPCVDEEFYNVYDYSSKLVVLKFKVSNTSMKLESIIQEAVKEALHRFGR